MQNILSCNPQNPLESILSQIERLCDGETQNYIHTHDRVFFDPENSIIRVDEICKNEYGSAYGLGRGGVAKITPEIAAMLPSMLLEKPNWMDF